MSWNSHSFRRQTTSFIIRLWTEQTEPGEAPEWRGQIERVVTGEREHFLDVPGLINALAKLEPKFSMKVSGCESNKEEL